jgi:hypothetical protein
MGENSLLRILKCLIVSLVRFKSGAKAVISSLCTDMTINYCWCILVTNILITSVHSSHLHYLKKLAVP